MQALLQSAHLEPTNQTSQTHFGQLLRRLYEARAMTARQLARAAEVGEASIFTALRSAQCPWKRSTSIRVMRGLETAARLSQSDAQLYIVATGLESLHKAGAEAYENVVNNTYPLELVAQMVEDFGSAPVAKALFHLDKLLRAQRPELDAAQEIATASKAIQDEKASSPAATPLRVVNQKVMENKLVTEFSPARVPEKKPTKPASKPHRRTGS